MIENAGDNLQENSPVLIALNNRLETRLAPTVGQIQTTLASFSSLLSLLPLYDVSGIDLPVFNLNSFGAKNPAKPMEIGR